MLPLGKSTELYLLVQSPIYLEAESTAKKGGGAEHILY